MRIKSNVKAGKLAASQSNELQAVSLSETGGALT
jgi:hypothetical protein